MQALKNIFHIMLVLAILSSGFPLYHPADANRDDKVDLADAILRVRDIVQTAENPSSFKSSLEDALLTLASVAGVQKVIKADRDQGNRINGIGGPIFVLTTGPHSGPLPIAATPIADRAIPYDSPILSPVTPPPRPA